MNIKRNLLCLILVLVVILTSCNLRDFDVENDSSSGDETTVETESVNEITDADSSETTDGSENNENSDSETSGPDEDSTSNETTVKGETTEVTTDEDSTSNETTVRDETTEVTTDSDETTQETTDEEETVIEIVCDNHSDTDDNGKCDVCEISVLVFVDLYAINDLHGKFCTTSANVGVEGLSTYLNNAKKTDDHAILLSSGDMWQGGPESNLTSGLIVTDWMNELDFASMTLGNHEFDWGEEKIEENAALAEFPFLAINIYSRSTNERVDYCSPSVIVDLGDIQIGIIGAVGDCYSSISSDKSEDVYFKVGSDLTKLVKDESERLRRIGVDYIVYSIHDGYGQSSSSTSQISSSSLASYYDVSLSGGYVDLVFEGHTHKNYVMVDSYGVYHLQGGGDNRGLSHVEIKINSANGNSGVQAAEYVSSSRYSSLTDDEVVDKLLDKYEDNISKADLVVGHNDSTRSSNVIKQLVAQLYYETGFAEWGDKYDIVLGGGFMSVRSPYNLYAGDVTYGTLNMLLPFDNQIVLCSVRGKDLKSKFLETTNSNYFIYLGEYGNQIKNSINNNDTYYIIVDTYTAYYSYNNLTIIAEYDPDVFARDLVADFISRGGWTTKTAQ